MKRGIAMTLMATAAIALSGCYGKTESRTIYLLKCDKPIERGRCKGQAFTDHPMSVRVFPDTQRVILKVPLHGAFSLGACEVFDADNWHCRFDDGSGHHGMVDGDYFRIPSREDELQVGVLRYWVTWARMQF